MATWGEHGITCSCGAWIGMFYASRSEGIGGREVWEIHKPGYLGPVDAWACRKCGRIFSSWNGNIGGFPLIGQANPLTESEGISKTPEVGTIMYDIESIYTYQVLKCFYATVNNAQVMLLRVNDDHYRRTYYAIGVMHHEIGIGNREMPSNRLSLFGPLNWNQDSKEIEYNRLFSNKEDPTLDADIYEVTTITVSIQDDPLTEDMDAGTTFRWRGTRACGTTAEQPGSDGTECIVIDSYECDNGTVVMLVQSKRNYTKYGICTIDHVEGIGGRRIRSNDRITFFGGGMFKRDTMESLYEQFKQEKGDPTRGYHETAIDRYDLTEDIENGDVFHTPRGGDVRIQAIHKEPIMAYVSAEDGIILSMVPCILVMAFVYIPGTTGGLHDKNAFYTYAAFALSNGIGNRQVIDTSKIHLPLGDRYDDAESALDKFNTVIDRSGNESTYFHLVCQLKDKTLGQIHESDDEIEYMTYRGDDTYCPCGNKGIYWVHLTHGIGNRDVWHIGNDSVDNTFIACLACGRIADNIKTCHVNQGNKWRYYEVIDQSDSITRGRRGSL